MDVTLAFGAGEDVKKFFADGHVFSPFLSLKTGRGGFSLPRAGA
jgi:hypothetical protein